MDKKRSFINLTPVTGATTLSITTFSIMTLSINDSQHKRHSSILSDYAECHAECRILLNVMLNVFMPSVVMLNVNVLKCRGAPETQHIQIFLKVFKNLWCKWNAQKMTCGLYYKLITIVIDAASVTLQIVASLTIIIDNAS